MAIAPTISARIVGPDADKSALQQDIRCWFESRSPDQIIAQDNSRSAPFDYMSFLRDESILTRSLCPTNLGGAGTSWDAATIFDTSENLAFHGFVQWLMWHVTSLGVLPVWMSGSAEMRSEYVEALALGGLAAFGMSEKSTGADWRDTSTVLTRSAEGARVDGAKHYVGNAQYSGMITLFARDSSSDGGYHFVRIRSGRKGFNLVRNAVPEQMYVAEFTLDNYGVTDGDLIVSGKQAFNDAVNTINIGKVNLATAAHGLLSRAVLETYAHTRSRSLFGVRTDLFGQNKRVLTNSVLRALAIRSYLQVCSEEMQRSSEGRDNYVVLNSVAKAWVTHLAEDAITALTDVSSALAFEDGSPIYSIRKYIGYLPRLEGTKYVNLMQTIKAIPGYFRAGEPTNSALHDNTPRGSDYLLSGRSLGGFKNSVFLSWQDAFQRLDDTDEAGLLAAISLFATWNEHHRPQRETDVESIGELFCSIVVLTEVARDSIARVGTELAPHVVNSLIEDLILTATRRYTHLRDIEFPVDEFLEHLRGCLHSVDIDVTPILEAEVEHHGPALQRFAAFNGES